MNLLITEDPDIEINLAMALIVSKIINPPSIEAARKQKDWPQWETSNKTKLEIHRKLGTGVLITPPLNVNIVGSWIMLHYKLDKDGSISMHKSRLVAQGFTQQEGTNYNDTFSTTAKLTAIQVLATTAVRNDWELEKTDMDTAYFNASLKEDIYMHQPRGFEAPSEEDQVIHLKRELYGLRQLIGQEMVQGPDGNTYQSKIQAMQGRAHNILQIRSGCNHPSCGHGRHHYRQKLSQSSADIQKQVKFMLWYQRHGQSMLATRYQNRQGLIEPNNLIFPSHLCTKNSGTLQHGRCQPTVHTNYPQPQSKQVSLTC